MQAVEARLQESIRRRSKNWKSYPIIFNGTVTVDPRFGIHRPVKLIQGRSLRLLRQEFPVVKSTLPTLWTHSYFCVTTAGVPLSVITHSIEQQKHV